MPFTHLDESQQFEWDESKNEQNIRKHRIDFVNAAAALLKPFLRKRSDQNNETRYLAISLMDDIAIAVIYTMRGDVCRIISAGQARKNEKEEYNCQKKRQ